MRNSLKLHFRIHRGRLQDEVQPIPLAPVTQSLRQRLLHELARLHLGMLPGHLIAQALRDAESVAALNPFPQLVLPLLAEEKVQAAKTWHQRQQNIPERTALSLAE